MPACATNQLLSYNGTEFLCIEIRTLHIISVDALPYSAHTTHYTLYTHYTHTHTAERKCICPSPMVGTDEPPTLPPEPPGGNRLSLLHCTDYSLLQDVQCLSLLMVVGLCVYPTPRSSIALCSVTTVMSSPVLPSTLTTVAKAPSSNGKTSLEQCTKTFPNVQVDI